MEGFESFSATHLYCAECKASMPVREVLLLVLPKGALYDYRCLRCGNSLGTKIDKENPNPGLKERRRDGFSRDSFY